MDGAFITTRIIALAGRQIKAFVRLSTGLPFAASITAGLFLLMASLVTPDNRTPSAPAKHADLQIIADVEETDPRDLPDQATKFISDAPIDPPAIRHSPPIRKTAGLEALKEPSSCSLT